MTEVTTKIFKSGNSVAVRLPREFGLTEGTEVVVADCGHQITLRRKRPSIKEMFDKLAALPRPSSVEERDVGEIPEPKGL